MFRINKISVLVVLVLLLQCPVLVLYLSRSSALVLPGSWPVGRFFFLLSFSSCCLVSFSPSEVWQLCSLLVVLLWSWIISVLVYEGLVSLPHPLSLGQGQSQWSVSWLLWWFAVCSSILQSRLTVHAQGLGPVVCHLLPFPTSGSSLSPTCSQPSCHLFTDGSHMS
jgi:hypothetical protein